MRYLSFGLGAAIVLTWLVFGLSHPESATVRHPLAPGRLYSVSADGGMARFDLPLAQNDEQYLLVIANLSMDTEPRRVVVTADKVQRVELVPLAAVRESPPEPIHARIRTRRATTSRAVAPKRVFWLPVAEGSTNNPAIYRKITSRLSGEGPHVRVYVDQKDRVASESVDALVRLCESEVRPTISKHLGWPRDVDGDGKLAILMTGWLGRLDGGRVSLGGMVRPADFRTDQRQPYSNRADVLYLNSTLRPGRHAETLLAHELAHAVTCSGRQETNLWWFHAGEEEVWLNEAIAHVAEDLQSDNRSNLDYRIAAYLASPGRAPLVIDDYRRAGLCRNPGTRGACYLFLRWCVERYGTPLLPKLIYSPRRGVENLEAATGSSFEDLFRRWTVELFLDARRVGEAARRIDDGGDLCRFDAAEPLGKWGLAGPRFETLSIAGAGEDDGGRLELSISGTAARHVLIAAESPGPRRITVRAEAGAALQVSLVRLPRAMARLKLEVVRDSAGGWRLRLSERAGREIRLSHVFWQATAIVKNARPPQKCLRQEELSELFLAAVVPAGGKVVSRVTDFAGMPRGKVAVCVAGTDEAGYRVAAWAEIDLAASDYRLALAGQEDSRAD